MKKIHARDHKRCYTIGLLPKTVTAEHTTYFVDRKEGRGYYHIMIKFLRSLGFNRETLTDVFARLKTLDQSGGLLVTMEVHKIPGKAFHEEDWIQLDLNYLAEKSVRLEVGGVDVTEVLKNNSLLQRLLNEILCGIYAAYTELSNINQLEETFIEEMFIHDDVDMSVNEKSEIIINVDSSLRDFLLDLNQKLQ